MKHPIKLMLIEDNPEYRNVLEFTLQDDPNIDLQSLFSTAEVALRRLQEYSPADAPDLILLDLNLPGMSGLDTIPWIKKYSPDTEIIILTQSNKQADVLSAISLGASGYLMKSSTVEQIKGAIHTVMDGGSSLDSDVARFILNTLQGRLPKPVKKPSLSEKETQILALLAEGLQKKEISAKLKISNNTVDTHVRHIYEKLNVKNAPAAIHKAHQTGLFNPEN
jgi:DNA-binding NarL/FixJ family response regulator